MKLNKKSVCICIIVLLIVSLFSIKVFAEPEKEVVENAIENTVEEKPLLISDRGMLISEKDALISDKGDNETIIGNKYVMEDGFSIKNETIEGDLYILGSGSLMNVNLNGDLFIMGDSITINNSIVNGDTFALGKSIIFNDVTFRRAVYSMSESFDVNNCKFERELFFAANKDSLDGIFERDIYMVGEMLNISENSEINGNVYCPADVQKSGNFNVKGEIIPYEVPTPTITEPTPQQKTILLVKNVLFSTIAIGLVILLLTKLDSNKIKEVSENMDFAKFIINTCKGFGVLIVGILVGIILLFTRLGLLGIIALLYIGIMIALATPLVALIVAYRINKGKETDKTMWLAILIAFVYVVVMSLDISFVFGILSFIIMMFSLGVGLDLLFVKTKKSNVEKPVVVEKVEEVKEVKEVKEEEKENKE